MQVKGTGAILDIGVWHFFINDCWILGGVHAHLEFHLVTKRTKAAIYPGYLSVTGRELIGLMAFGYQISQTALEEIVHCVDVVKASNASFAQYVAAMQNADNKIQLYITPS